MNIYGHILYINIYVYIYLYIINLYIYIYLIYIYTYIYSYEEFFIGYVTIAFSKVKKIKRREIYYTKFFLKKCKLFTLILKNFIIAYLTRNNY